MRRRLEAEAGPEVQAHARLSSFERDTRLSDREGRVGSPANVVELILMVLVDVRLRELFLLLVQMDVQCPMPGVWYSLFRLFKCSMRI